MSSARTPRVHTRPPWTPCWHGLTITWGLGISCEACGKVRYCAPGETIRSCECGGDVGTIFALCTRHEDCLATPDLARACAEKEELVLRLDEVRVGRSYTPFGPR